MTRAFAIAAAASVLVLLGVGCSSDDQAGLAPAGPGTRRVCFRPDEIKHWSDTGGGNFVVRTDRDDFFASRVGGDCIDINWANEIAVRPQFGHLQLCTGDGATLITREQTGNYVRRCEAFAFRKLTPEEVTALPDSAKR